MGDDALERTSGFRDSSEKTSSLSTTSNVNSSSKMYLNKKSGAVVFGNKSNEKKANYERRVKERKAASCIVSRAKGYLTRKNVIDTRLRCRNMAKENKTYVVSSTAKSKKVETMVTKFELLDVLSTNRDFRESLTKVKVLIQNHQRALNGLKELIVELSVHPGIGGDEVHQTFTRRSSEMTASCARIVSHVKTAVEDLLSGALSIEAERLAGVLKRLKRVRNVNAKYNEKDIVEREFKAYRDAYALAEKCLCDVAFLEPGDLYTEESDFDPMGFMFLDGIRRCNFFAIVHPGVDEADANTALAERAAKTAEMAFEEEKRRRVMRLNLVLMRREEIERLRYLRQKRTQGDIERHHRAFVALCREWWSEGRVRHARELAKRVKDAHAKARREAALRQTKIDATQTDPYSAANSEVSVRRMRELMRDEARRQRFQEHGRVFKVDDRQFETGERLLHNACWSGRLELVDFLVRECNADVNQISDRISGLTPLHVACRAGASDVVKRLVELGADVYQKDAAGDTAFHWAARRDNVGTVRAMLGLNPLLSGNEDIETIGRAESWVELLTAVNERGRQARELSSSATLRRLFESEIAHVTGAIKRVKRRQLARASMHRASAK